MAIFEEFTVLTTPYVFTAIMGIIGLLVGSFLNVVIYRLPIMMQRQWRQDCLTYLNVEHNESESTKIFNLAWPPSSCPQCQTPILARHNIPVVSYLWLRGKCSVCHSPIAVRYPLIELLTALLSMIIAWHLGFNIQVAAGLFLTWALIALSGIDFDHKLLPDVMVLPLLWLGLFLSLFKVFSNPEDSIIGAIAGYLVLWLVYHGFKLITGKEGMGYGDFKLLAMLGAWLGWQYLGLIILLSSLVGAILGMTLIALNKQQCATPIPFGPYLALAGWITLLWGDDLNSWYFGSLPFG